jgi:hypothetical protein
MFGAALHIIGGLRAIKALLACEQAYTPDARDGGRTGAATAADDRP